MPDPVPVPPALSREALIALCEDAVRPQVVWGNRDSEAAHRQVGEAWVLLKAGCDFRISRGGGLVTDENTVWIYITSRGFQWFEISEMREGHFYIPTRERLDKVGDDDWY